MYVPINPLGYSCIKELQRDNLLHAYNEPIDIYSEIQSNEDPKGLSAYHFRQKIWALSIWIWTSISENKSDFKSSCFPAS